MIIINKIELEETKWIGLALRTKTTNEMGRSGIDCGNLWQEFEKENNQTRFGRCGIDFYSLQPASDF